MGGWEANFSLAVSLAEGLDQFVADDLDDLLAGREGSQHFLSDGFGLDVVDQSS